jgi:hypothetical protein
MDLPIVHDQVDSWMNKTRGVGSKTGWEIRFRHVKGPTATGLYGWPTDLETRALQFELRARADEEYVKATQAGHNARDGASTLHRLWCVEG